MKPIKAAIISVSGYTLTDEEKRILAQENPLGVSLFMRNIASPEQLRSLTQDIKNIVSRDDILIATDQEGGRVCRLKPPHFRKYMAQSAIGSLPSSDKRIQAARLHAELIADDLHAVGINCNFAPTLDVLTPNMTSALKSRCFSDNGQLVTTLGKIILETYSQTGIVACIKHFPGHSGAVCDPHLQLPSISSLNESYSYPFQQLSSLALMGMTAHIVIEGIDSLPITVSPKAIQSLIRGKFGFKGILVSDALEMKALSGSLQEKCNAAINAGCNAVCYCKGDIEGIRTVLGACGYLSDDALQTLKQISTLIATSYIPEKILQKETSYACLTQESTPLFDDYDAVEVLNQL